MDLLRQKIRLIYVPFLVIATSFIISYTLFNWLVLIKLDVFETDQDIINFWLPILLAIIPILIWLRPRIGLLKLNKKSGGMPVFYHLVAIMALAIPTMVAQVYVERATGKLQKLENVNQITLQNQTKYYQINHFYIDKQNISSSVIFEMGSSDGIGAFIIG